MEWIKIKPGQILFKGYTPQQIGTLVQIQCLVAIAEHPLTEAQLLQNVHKSSYISLQNVLNMESISIQYICNKVLEDVENVNRMKHKAKIKKAEQREKLNNVPTPLIEDVPLTDKIRVDKIREDKKREGRVAFAPPSLSDVLVYCKERNNTVNAQTFIDFYSAKGWMMGKNKVKDWKACVRTWEQRASEKTIKPLQYKPCEPSDNDPAVEPTKEQLAILRGFTMKKIIP